jgi:hypothetical protein
MATSWYKKTAVQVAIITVVGTVIVAGIGAIVRERSDATPAGSQIAQNSPGAVQLKMENSPGSIQAAGGVVLHPGEIPEQELKAQIRAVLARINPEILRRIDQGQKKVPVMINTMKLQTLLQLSNHPGYPKFIQLQGTGSQFRGVNRGGTAQIGNNLNDVDQSGALDGYVLLIGDALRE